MSTLQVSPRVVPRCCSSTFRRPEQVRLYLEWKMCIYSKSLYTNLPKRNTLFFNCTSISCCCENNLLPCVNQVFFGLRHYTKTHVETVRSRQASAYFDEKKNTIFLKCVVGSSQHTKAISRWKYAMLKSDYLFNFYWFRFNEMSNGEAETVRTLIWLWLKLWSVRCVAYIGPGLRD